MRQTGAQRDQPPPMRSLRPFPQPRRHPLRPQGPAVPPADRLPRPAPRRRGPRRRRRPGPLPRGHPTMSQQPSLYPSWAPTADTPHALSSAEAVLEAARELVGTLPHFTAALEALAAALDLHDTQIPPPAATPGHDPTRGGPTGEDP